LKVDQKSLSKLLMKHHPTDDERYRVHETEGESSGQGEREGRPSVEVETPKPPEESPPVPVVVSPKVKLESLPGGELIEDAYAFKGMHHIWDHHKEPGMLKLLTIPQKACFSSF
jgi:hypothetical protein